jgi:MoaA/NifB/PqqE/SkfB family radical SAM enzyme
MSSMGVDQRLPLRQFVLKPTVYCYHRCPYCDLRQDYYQEIVTTIRRKSEMESESSKRAPALRTGHMPLDLALRAIDEAAELGMEELQLSGGDPLLYPYLTDLIRAAKAHPGVFVLMNSVGTGVTVERAAEIIDAGLGAWNFSVDTLDATLYDELRGIRNGLATILDAVATVREAGDGRDDFRMNFMTVITRQSFRGLPDVIRHCVENGIASVYLMNVYGDDTGTSLLTVPEIHEFRREVVPAILDVLTDVEVEEVVRQNAANVLAEFFSSDNSDENYANGIYWPDDASVKAACGLPNFYSLIEPDGRALPCCLVEIAHEGEVGNLYESSLSEIWQGPRLAEFRDERIPFCRKCSSPRNRTLGLIPSMCRQFRP